MDFPSSSTYLEPNIFESSHSFYPEYQNVSSSSYANNLRATLKSEAESIAKQQRKLRRKKLKAQHNLEELNQAWRALDHETAKLAADKRRLDAALSSDWFQKQILPTVDETRVKINVGGQVFETAYGTLRKDPHSLLAAITHDDSPVPSGEDGYIFFDRDWWLFRLILDFLRTESLPTKKSQLRELYEEANFFGLSTLSTAIENRMDSFSLIRKSRKNIEV